MGGYREVRIVFEERNDPSIFIPTFSQYSFQLQIDS